MKKYFETIEELLKVRSNCVFCKSPLKPFLTNYFKSNKRIPFIKGIFIDNICSFDLKYLSDNKDKDIDVAGYINIQDNTLKFNPSIESNDEVIDAFIKYLPYAGLNCNNKQCKHAYYLSSEVFNIDNRNNTCKIATLELYMEAFKFDKYWIQNNWASKTATTNIHPIIPNINTNVITVPIIDLESQDISKILNKIKTIITFS